MGEKLCPIIRNWCKYWGIALGSRLHHQFQKYAHIPRQSVFINCTCAHASPGHVVSFTPLGRVYGRHIVHVLYLCTRKSTYLGHNQVAVLNISLFPPHNVLGHVSPAYL